MLITRRAIALGRIRGNARIRVCRSSAQHAPAFPDADGGKRGGQNFARRSKDQRGFAPVTTGLQCGAMRAATPGSRIHDVWITAASSAPENSDERRRVHCRFTLSLRQSSSALRGATPKRSNRRKRRTHGVAGQSLSSVMGSSRTRLPVACQMAFATAAATPTTPISPTPFTPSGLTISSCSFTKITSMSRMSALTGT